MISWVGGLSVAAGYVQAIYGGAANIIVSQTSSPGQFAVFSSGKWKCNRVNLLEWQYVIL